MVFSGKPSTGCQMCRTRRIKCDEAKPACRQCMRTGRSCPGYKSQIDLIFRNETGASAAEKRARSAARKVSRKRQGRLGPDRASAPVALPTRTAASSGGGGGSGSSSDYPLSYIFLPTYGRRHSASSSSSSSNRGSQYDDDGSNSSTSPSSASSTSIIPALSVPPDELAVCHFFANFVLVPFQGTGRGYMDFLVPMMKNAACPTSAFASSSTPAIAKMGAAAAGDVATGGVVAANSSYRSSSSTREEARAALTFAFRACALASMGTRVASNSFAFADKALSAYTRALAATHLALRDPELSKADSTLGAVLLLSLFESITAKQMGLFAWGSHIEGAIEIVKARAHEQRKTKTGLSLFIAVRTQMIIHSLASGKAPEMDLDWWLSDAVSDRSAAACQRLAIRTAALRAEAAECMNSVAAATAASAADRGSSSSSSSPPAPAPSHVARVAELARQAHALDRACVAWAADVPSEWRYHAVAWQDKLPEGGDYARAEVFPGRVDVYRDIYIASVWNMVRATRLCLLSIAVRCAAWACAPADYRTTSQYAAAARTCSALIADIIASVPFFLGWPQRERERARQKMHQQKNARGPVQPPSPPSPSSSPSPSPSSSPSPSATTSTHLDADAAYRQSSSARFHDDMGFACGDESGLKGLAGYFLAWPLSNVNSQDYTTDDQRTWACGRLRYIANELGVRYAGFLADLKFRVPSMMIRRDRLVTQHQMASSHGVQALLAAPTAPPAAGYTLNPLQQWEALQKQSYEADRAELVAKASGESGPYGKWVAQKMLHV